MMRGVPTAAWRQMKAAPFSAMITILMLVVVLILAAESWRAYQADQLKRLWLPFSEHEIEATTDGQILYFVLSGHKTTTLALTAQVHAFIVGGVTHAVACYRPDGTVCAPNPVIGAATTFRSPTFRAIVPSQVVADANATFRVCYTYGGTRTWCDEIRFVDVPIDHERGNGFDVIEQALSGDPRRIEPLR